MKICMEFSYFEVDMMKSKGLPEDFCIWHLVAKEDLAFGQANKWNKNLYEKASSSLV